MSAKSLVNNSWKESMKLISKREFDDNFLGFSTELWAERERLFSGVTFLQIPEQNRKKRFFLVFLESQHDRGEANYVVK